MINEDYAPTTFEEFAEEVCNNCTANDYYCPSYCDLLEKASKISFERIRKKYIEHEGDIGKVCRYIKNTKR